MGWTGHVGRWVGDIYIKLDCKDSKGKNSLTYLHLNVIMMLN